jgi:hypothetical protein
MESKAGWSEELINETYKALGQISCPDPCFLQNRREEKYYFGSITWDNLRQHKWIVNIDKSEEIQEYKSLDDLIKDGWVLD